MPPDGFPMQGVLVISTQDDKGPDSMLASHYSAGTAKFKREEIGAGLWEVMKNLKCPGIWACLIWDKNHQNNKI